MGEEFARRMDSCIYMAESLCCSAETTTALLISCLLMFGHPVVSNYLWPPYGLQHTRPPCPSPSPEVCPSSCPLLQWCHPAISSSDTLFSFCPQESAIPQYKISFKVKKRKKERRCFQCSQDQRPEGLVSDWLDVLMLPPMSSTQEW